MNILDLSISTLLDGDWIANVHCSWHYCCLFPVSLTENSNSNKKELCNFCKHFKSINQIAYFCVGHDSGKHLLVFVFIKVSHISEFTSTPKILEGTKLKPCKIPGLDTKNKKRNTNGKLQTHKRVRSWYRNSGERVLIS